MARMELTARTVSMVQLDQMALMELTARMEKMVSMVLLVRKVRRASKV